MARSTYAEISHKLVDGTAKTEAAYTMTTLLAKTSFAQLKDDSYTVQSDTRETLEHNAWLADGTALLAPDNPATITWGVWSKQLSNSAGIFPVPPVLTATFASVHTSAGLTFLFCGDTWPSSITITWYQGATQLAAQTFAVDRAAYFAERTVAAYNKVTVAFNGTKIPKRRVKIAEIDYGALIIWGAGNITKGNILEECNPTSTECTVNTLDFEVHDDNAKFNMLNPAGAYVALQQKQELTVAEYINGVRTELGKYYLDTWENKTANIAAFTAYGSLGLFDSIEFKTSALYNGVAAGTIYAAIFATAGWTNYTIDATISTELVYGYIPCVSVREALHQLSFALRAACLQTRTGGIVIKRVPNGATTPIEKAQKLGSQTVKQTELVNSVAVTAHAFTAGASTQLYTQALTTGSYIIKFDKPATGLSITGGTITASGVNYAAVTVVTAGTVTITGTPLVDSTKIYVVETTGLTALTRAQASVEDCTLVSTANAVALAQYLYDDYQRRIIQSFKLTLATEQAGDSVDVDTMLGARKTGLITKLDIDIAGGLLANCEVRG